MNGTITTTSAVIAAVTPRWAPGDTGPTGWPSTAAEAIEAVVALESSAARLNCGRHTPHPLAERAWLRAAFLRQQLQLAPAS